jgi:hypothetical protein
MNYELKLSKGRPIIWSGTSGENAAVRAVDAARVAGRPIVVVAWRPAPEDRHGLFVLGGGRIEG